MISSGKLSDRKQVRKVDCGYCDSECPFFRYNKKNDPYSGATCFDDAKEIIYYDGFLAHCEIKKDK